MWTLWSLLDVPLVFSSPDLGAVITSYSFPKALIRDKNTLSLQSVAVLFTNIVLRLKSYPFIVLFDLSV